MNKIVRSPTNIVNSGMRARRLIPLSGISLGIAPRGTIVQIAKSRCRVDRRMPGSGGGQAPTGFNDWKNSRTPKQRRPRASALGGDSARALDWLGAFDEARA